MKAEKRTVSGAAAPRGWPPFPAGVDIGRTQTGITARLLTPGPATEILGVKGQPTLRDDRPRPRRRRHWYSASPYWARVPMPGRAPPTFCMTRRNARPMAPPAGWSGSGPSRPPGVEPDLPRHGTVDDHRGKDARRSGLPGMMVGVLIDQRLTAAIRTGRYSGRPPAIADVVARVATSAIRPCGRILPITVSGGRSVAPEDPADPLRRRRQERQAVAPKVPEEQGVGRRESLPRCFPPPG